MVIFKKRFAIDFKPNENYWRQLAMELGQVIIEYLNPPRKPFQLSH